MINKSLQYYLQVFCLTVACLIPQHVLSDEPLLFQDYIQSIKIIKLEKAIFSSPAATWNDHVIVGSHDKCIYFFNKKGDLIKKFETRGWVHASPTILPDSSIAIGSYDGYIYFFNTMGELKEKIKPAKGSLFTSVIDFHSRFLVYGSNKKGIVFFNKEDSTSHIYPVKRWVHGTPSIVNDDKLAIGSNDKHIYIFDRDANLITKVKTRGWIMHSAPVSISKKSFAFGSYDKKLYIYNLEEDKMKSFKTKGRIHSTPLKTKDSRIVFGSFDRFIYFLKPDGTLFKKYKTRKKVVSSAVSINDSIIVIGSYDRNLYFFSNEGVLLGSYKTKGRIFSTPIVLSNNTIVVCTTNGYIEYLKVNPLPEHPKPLPQLTP